MRQCFRTRTQKDASVNHCGAGLHFFPRLITTGKQAFHDQVALSWQRKGRQQLLDQQALRLESLLNPVKLFERPADPTAALRLFDGPVAGKEEGFLPTVPQELQPQAQVHPTACIPPVYMMSGKEL